jgi:hypothetical protein
MMNHGTSHVWPPAAIPEAEDMSMEWQKLAELMINVPLQQQQQKQQHRHDHDYPHFCPSITREQPSSPLHHLSPHPPPAQTTSAAVP